MTIALGASRTWAVIALVTPPTVNNFGCGENQAGNTLNIGTPNATVTAGDYLFLVISGIGSVQGAAGSTTVVTGITNGNGVCTAGSTCVWQQVPNIATVYDNAGGRSDIWYAIAPMSGANGAGVMVNTSSGNTFVGACMFEVSGLAPSTVVDQSVATDVTAAATNLSSPEILGNGQPELFLAVSSCANIGYQALAPFTPLDGVCIGAGCFPDGIGGCPGAYLIANGTGPQSVTLVQTPAGTGAVGIASTA